MNQTTISKDYVSFSVQGSLFVLKRQFVESQEWIIANALQSDVPIEMIDGHYFLDIDSGSFRLLVNIMKKMSDATLVAKKLCDVELLLLIETARYLGCKKILEELESVSNAIKSDIETYKQELCEQRQLLKTMRNEKQKYEDIVTYLNDEEMVLIECRGYRTRRPYNICGEIFLILGPIERKSIASLKCSYCTEPDMRVICPKDLTVQEFLSQSNPHFRNKY